MRPTTSRLRFQPSRSAPSLPHQAPNERAENTGIPKASKPRKSNHLDPLENNIRKERSLPDSLARGSIRPSCRPVPWSLTAAEALAKFFCRPVRDDRVTFRGRMESAAGRAARKVEHAEGTLIEVVLRPLIAGEKDVPAYAWFVWDRDASGSELKWF